MTRSSRCISARVHLPKSVPFGYHLWTKRLQFSTEPFSQDAFYAWMKAQWDRTDKVKVLLGMAGLALKRKRA